MRELSPGKMTRVSRESVEKALAEGETGDRIRARVTRLAMIWLLIALVIVVVVLSIACLYFGIVCLGKCELEPLVPIYLLTFAVVTLSTTPNYFAWLVDPEKQSRAAFIVYAVYRITTWVLEFGVLIFGSVMLYRFPIGELQDLSKKCLCLKVGFALVTFSWAVLVLTLLVSCVFTCLYAYAIMKEIKPSAKPQDKAQKPSK